MQYKTCDEYKYKWIQKGVTVQPFANGAQWDPPKVENVCLHFQSPCMSEEKL